MIVFHNKLVLVGFETHMPHVIQHGDAIFTDD